jgi:serine protease
MKLWRRLPLAVLGGRGVSGVLVLLLALSAFGVSRAAPGESRPEAAPEAVPGELIVRFRTDIPPAAQAHAVGRMGAAFQRTLLTGRHALVRVPAGQEEAFIDRLYDRPEIEHVERNLVRRLSAKPNDPYFDLQFNMSMIQLEQAHDVTRGAGVTVAVLDSGVAFEDWFDPYASVQYAPAPDFAVDFVYPYHALFQDEHANDDDGHGTHVAGTIAQATNNGLGVAGVAPEVDVMPVKVCGGLASPTDFCPSWAIADGIIWAADHGADVINMSLGGPSITQAEAFALDYAYQQGVVVVAAAGNGGIDEVGDPVLDYPAAYPTVISVAAINFNGTRTSYSNYGVDLDFSAPGGNLFADQNGDGEIDGIWQVTFSFTCGPGPIDFTSFAICPYQGTSMATAHVTGIVALLLSRFPGLSPHQVKQTLACSAKDLGPAGYDTGYGYGLVQAYDALQDVNGNGVPDCLDSIAATPTPTPSPSPSPSPTPTPSPTPSSTPTPSPTSSPTPTPAPTPSPTPTHTPTATPTPTPRGTPEPGGVKGDVDCNGAVDVVDALRILRYVAGLNPNLPGGCPPSALADMDCNETVDAVDALLILRYVAALPVNLPAGCPPPGTPVAAAVSAALPPLLGRL